MLPVCAGVVGPPLYCREAGSTLAATMPQSPQTLGAGICNSKAARSGRPVFLWGCRSVRALPAQNGPIVGSWYADEAAFFDSEFRIVHAIAWAPIPEHKPKVDKSPSAGNSLNAAEAGLSIAPHRLVWPIVLNFTPIRSTCRQTTVQCQTAFSKSRSNFGGKAVELGSQMQAPVDKNFGRCSR